MKLTPPTPEDVPVLEKWLSDKELLDIREVAHINAVWEADEAGKSLKVMLDDSGNPIGMEADGEVLFTS